MTQFKTKEDLVVAGMARAMFVSDYADKNPEKEAPGLDWMITAPKTPYHAYNQAWKLLGKVELASGCGIYTLISRAEHANKGALSDGELKLLGHYIAMQAMGHGVSWFDSNPKFDITIPHFEYHD